ncbi:hypothetical protein HYH03_000317 [Edaphochlamys debaryana]|uniref:Protein kinase domain-containing protein n=1 Tax=Edaphochlamys debaryana TaxID=47281 RepID=A0A835YIF8_9CHLO|nr:hypothetical protein HYH03_000317 [Edaphochlamys debaryana]|eukprot:KAG2501818.1 hypothetical protein HYH03_000317 [Edaphochlamys debaryana]
MAFSCFSCFKGKDSPTLDAFQSALLGLTGSWLKRLHGVTELAEASFGHLVELYGITETGDHVLLCPSSSSTCQARNDPALQDQVGPLIRLARTGGRLVTHALYVTSSHASMSAASTAGTRLAAAVPLLHAGRVAAVLWIEERAEALTAPLSVASRQCKPAEGRATASRKGLLEGIHLQVEGGASLAQPTVSSSGAAPSELLSSPDALRRLAFAVSFAISGSDDPPGQLSWLSGAVGRLAASASMQALLAELCGAVAAHVQRRFTLECSVQAALAQGPATASGQAPPPESGHMALLFKLQPSAGEAPVSTAGEQRDLSLGVDGHLYSASATKAAHRASLLLQGRASTPTTPTAAGAASPLRATTFSNTPPLDESLCVGGSQRSVARCVAGGGSPAVNPPHGHTLNGSHSQAHMGSPATTPGNGDRGALGRSQCSIVIPLSAAEAAACSSAAAPPPALHASAFPMQRTLLGMILAKGKREQAAEAAAGGSGTVGAAAAVSAPVLSSPVGTLSAVNSAVVEDANVFVQNVHSPSRDVCLLLAGHGAAKRRASTVNGMVGYSSSTNVVLPEGAAAGALASGAAGTASQPPSTSVGPTHSLVLLTLTGLPEGSALGLYVCFPKRLPAPLLEAVRAGGQELLEQALAGPVREQLCGPLAAEYSTLRTATPGSYAVVRAATFGPEEHAASPSMHGQAPNSGRGGGAVDSVSRKRLLPASGMPVFSTQTTVSSCMDTADLEAIAEAEPQAAASQAQPRRRSLAVEQLKGLSVIRRASLSVDRGRATTPTHLAGGTLGGAAARNAEAAASICNSRSASFSVRVYDRLTGAASRAAAAAKQDASSGNHGAEDLLDFLMNSCNTELACGPAAPAMDAPNASIITVEEPQLGSAMARQQMDLLVTSIQQTLNTGGNSMPATVFASDLENLELLEVLGRGGGGVVLRGLLNGSLHVAVKLMEMPDVEPEAAEGAATADPAGTAAAAKQLRARREMTRNAMELVVQSGCSHPNIVQFYSTFNHVVLRSRDGTMDSTSDPRSLYLEIAPPVPEKGDNEARVTAILAEYCDAGSLGSALQARSFPRLARTPVRAVPGQSPFPYDLKGIYMTLLDVALALRHLHAMNLVHRDLKPANLLLKSNPLDYRGFTVKLADFGFVLHLNEVAEDGTRFATVDQACGTVTHMAPECLPGKARIDASCDVYSFGIIMWELLAGGVRPYPTTHPDKIPRMVYKGARPVFADNVPPSFRALAQLCWGTTPSRRPSAADLVTAITAQLQAVGQQLR